MRGVVLSVASSYFLNKKWYKALRCYNVACKIRGERVQTSHTTHIINRKGICLLQIGRFTEALKHFKDEYPLRRETPRTYPYKADEIACFLNQGLCYFGLRYWKDAIKYSMMFLSAISFNNLSMNSDSATCETMVGICLFLVGNYEEAERHFETELSIRLEMALADSTKNDQALCYYNLGRCQFNLNKLEDAYTNLFVALGIWEHSNETDCLPRAADCLNLIGAYFCQKQDYSKALDFYGKEKTIRNSLKSYRNIDMKMALNHFHSAQCLFSIGRYQESSKAFKTAKNFFKSNNNNEASLMVLANCFNMIGLCKSMMLEYTAGLRKFTKELDIRKQLLLGSPNDNQAAEN